MPVGSPEALRLLFHVEQKSRVLPQQFQDRVIDLIQLLHVVDNDNYSDDVRDEALDKILTEGKWFREKWENQDDEPGDTTYLLERMEILENQLEDNTTAINNQEATLQQLRDEIHTLKAWNERFYKDINTALTTLRNCDMDNTQSIVQKMDQGAELWRKISQQQDEFRETLRQLTNAHRGETTGNTGKEEEPKTKTVDKEKADTEQHGGQEENPTNPANPVKPAKSVTPLNIAKDDKADTRNQPVTPTKVGPHDTKSKSAMLSPDTLARLLNKTSPDDAGKRKRRSSTPSRGDSKVSRPLSPGILLDKIGAHKFNRRLESDPRIELGTFSGGSRVKRKREVIEISEDDE
ncbi:hypothetical protein FQN54_005956 [Arachnomyces sp. PD_36]|nr:hypothetical protein FQN54_005956 [Arachnomyces sp. PD_36]